jgi:hypothetical protein
MAHRQYTDAERLELALQKVARTESGCWDWTGTIATNGYGRMPLGKRNRRQAAHRFVYEQVVGTVPDGMQLDHLCGNRRCVNPSHLEPVTSRENNLRSPSCMASVNAAKTHCAQGHPFEGRNLIVSKRGQRVCRKCENAVYRKVKPDDEDEVEQIRAGLAS